MATLYWIKLYHEILDDFKMYSLSDHLFRRAIELFLLAGEHNKGGLLPEMAAMSWRLHTTDEKLQSDIDSLARVGILRLDGDSWMVVNFKKRQRPMKKAEYMRRKRDDVRKDKYYGDEDSQDEDSQDGNGWDNSEQETERTEVDVEINDLKDFVIRQLEMSGASKAAEFVGLCEVVSDGNGAINIISDCEDTAAWLKDRGLPYLKNIVKGVEDYDQVVIV